MSIRYCLSESLGESLRLVRKEVVVGGDSIRPQPTAQAPACDREWEEGQLETPFGEDTCRNCR